MYIFRVAVRYGGGGSGNDADSGDKALPEEEEKEDINKLRASARNNSLGIVPL